MNKALYLALFAAGATVGSLAAWRYTKTKYEKWAQEEITAVREYYKNAFETMKEETAETEEATPVVLEKVEAPKVEEKKVEVKAVKDGPYVIPPEEFGEMDGYETVTLIYYADEVLTDDADDPIDDIDGMVGFDSLSHFGEYEDDSVFVRNDQRRCDYEILLDNRRYEDIYYGV